MGLLTNRIPSGMKWGRRLTAMKWRTTFLALAIFCLFQYGPQLRSTSETGRIGRQLMQSNEYGSGFNPEDMDDMDGDDMDEDDNDDTTNPPPTCRMNATINDPLTNFKSALRRYLKAHPDPAEANIICTPETQIAKLVCNDTSGNYTMNTRLEITADDCRSITETCVIDPQKTDPHKYEPAPPPDGMFPPDAFTEEQRKQGAVICHIFGCLYMFYALALVCDYFFVPTLDVIIETFGISDDVAGATFMAAGGSAPELFTAVIGVFIAVSDVGIGTIVGSAVFNVLFVIAACAFASEKALQLTAWPLIRDTTFYSIALIVLVVFFVDDIITWWEALILFLWYFAYVTFMKFNETFEKQFLKIFPGLKDDREPIKGLVGFHDRHRPTFLNMMKNKLVTDGNETDGQEQEKNTGLVALKNKLEEVKQQDNKIDEVVVQEKNTDDDVTDAKEDKVKEDTDTANIKEDTKEEKKGETSEQGNKKYKEDSATQYVRDGPPEDMFGKILWILAMPLVVPMLITIPDPRKHSMTRFFPLSFIMSIIWIAVYSYFMVWWATIAGDAIGISDAVMGLTFLAAGTSVPDLITSVLVAKEGKGDMAVSSSIGSNLFDVTVGLPLPWLLYTIINGKAMEVNSVGMGCSIGMLFVMLLLVFVSIIAFNWKMTKPMGGIMLLLYVVFVVVSLGLSECWFVCFI